MHDLRADRELQAVDCVGSRGCDVPQHEKKDPRWPFLKKDHRGSRQTFGLAASRAGLKEGGGVRHMHTGQGRHITQPHFIIRTRVSGIAQRALGHAQPRW